MSGQIFSLPELAITQRLCCENKLSSKDPMLRGS